jgi:hypothetical protein
MSTGRDEAHNLAGRIPSFAKIKIAKEFGVQGVP